MIHINLLAGKSRPWPITRDRYYVKYAFLVALLLPAAYASCPRPLPPETATAVAQNPLRIITSRIPVFEDLYGDGSQKLTHYLEGLDCSHQVITYLIGIGEEKSKRRRCEICGEIARASIPRKPVESAREDAPGKKAV